MNTGRSFEISKIYILQHKLNILIICKQIYSQLFFRKLSNLSFNYTNFAIAYFCHDLIYPSLSKSFERVNCCIALYFD